MENNENSKEHPFTKTLGVGPYKVVGFMDITKDERQGTKMSGDTHITRHPQWKGGAGTCQHCGMAIMNICVIRTGTGDLHGVGTTCVLKAGMPEKERTIVEKKLRIKQANQRVDLYNRKKQAIIWATQNKTEELKAMPHPSEYHQKHGDTYLEYCQFATRGNWKDCVAKIYKLLLSKKIIDKV
jgi:hypothetical protein